MAHDLNFLSAKAKRRLLGAVILLIICASLPVLINASIFGPKRSINFPTAAHKVAAGDFNNDGIPDLAVARFPEAGFGAVVSILIGIGDGNFAPERKIRASANDSISYISDIEVADLNGDNKLDLVVSRNQQFFFPPSFNGLASVSIFLGNGEGFFQTPLDFIYIDTSGNNRSTHIEAITIGDFNLDGKLDINAVGFITGGEGRIFPVKNLGKGQFTPVFSLDIAYLLFDVAKGDFNADGKMDIVTASDRGPIIFYGNGNMSFDSAEQRDISFRDHEKITAGDFNRDGRADFAITNKLKNEIRVFINSAGGFPQLPKRYFIKGEEINSTLTNADFNGDGILDLAIGVYRKGKVRIYFGRGDGSFIWGDDVSSGQLPSGIAAADLDRNGKIDLIVSDLGNTNADKISIFLNSANSGKEASDGKTEKEALF